MAFSVLFPIGGPTQREFINRVHVQRRKPRKRERENVCVRVCVCGGGEGQDIS